MARECHLLHIAADPPVRAWTGFGDLDVPADAVEPDGARYNGVGEVADLPAAIQQLINGTSQSLDIVLSGVSANMLRLALEDAPEVAGAACYIGTVAFDDGWHIVDVEWEAQLRVDTVSVDAPPASNGVRERTITLTLGSLDTGRTRTANRYFTDADQRQRSPTDRFFERVSGMASNMTRRFGPK